MLPLSFARTRPTASRTQTATTCASIRHALSPLLVAAIGLFSIESQAVTMYGKMIGTITGYENFNTSPVGNGDFNTWLTGSSASPIGTTIEYNFVVNDWQYIYSGSDIAPVVNTASDPLHYGTYGGGHGTSSDTGNLRNGNLLVGNKPILNGNFSAQQTLINDLAPGDKFTWNTSYYESNGGWGRSIDFSLLTQQNILNSGFTTQEFYWLRSNDPAGIATGVFSTSHLIPFYANYTFNVDRLSLTLSQNPEPPTIPLPGSAWLLGSALLGLLKVRTARN